MTNAVTERPIPTARQSLRADLGPVSGIPLTRLTRVELRKLVDTTAGRWFAASIGLVTLLIVGIMFFVDGGNHSYMAYFQATLTPLAILLPILGIMGVTAEWSQRTAMGTFALEPRRGRVVLAKVLASVVMGIFAFAVSLAVAAVGHWLAVTVQDATPNWEVSSWIIGGAALLLALSLGQGLAFGMLILNTAAAIVAYFVVPMLWSMVVNLIPAMRPAAEWLDTERTFQPLMMGNAPTGEEWSQLGTSIALWLVLPLVLGIWRIMRSEVK